MIMSFILELGLLKKKKKTQKATNNDNGKAPPSSWRNYDDFNEYFCSSGRHAASDVSGLAVKCLAPLVRKMNEPCTEIQRLFPIKLRSRWLVPYTVSQVFLHGALEASKEDGTTFIVNGQHAKHYEEGLLQGKGTYKNDKAGLTLADLAYRRAKAVKNHQKKSNKSNPLPKPSSSRLEEMRELFQSDVKDKKPKRRGS
ncbi:unnamed protein product [Trifolium pratense]|uniref:Uncharacterized protein n=1 Tax=Trifolium pratense TaxID=57577 RepID=A0ACB0JD54_TRIPR|nr:unnamed protein product [Trifolium pratense]